MLRFKDYVLVDIKKDEETGNPQFSFQAVEDLKGGVSRPSFDAVIGELDANSLTYDVFFDPAVIPEGEPPTDEVMKAVQSSMNSFLKGLLRNIFAHLAKLHENRTYPFTGKSYIERPVFHHYALSYKVRGNKISAHLGGMTTAIMYMPEEESFYFGFSFCQKDEAYAKNIGNELAYRTLKTSPLIISLKDFEKLYIEKKSWSAVPGLEVEMNVKITDPIPYMMSMNSYLLHDNILSFLENNALDYPLRENLLKDCHEPRSYHI